MMGRLVDRLLEATIVGSFTKIGAAARRNLDDWSTLDELDMGGQVVVLTGGTSGIGAAAVEWLLRIGADVHLTSRSRERAEESAAEANDRNHDDRRGTAYGHPLDTSDFDSIHAFAKEIAAAVDGIDVLINNAGALTSDYATDARGTELTLSSHLIGPYLLTKELRPALNDGARVIFMSSGGMYTQGLDVDDIEMTADEYRGAVAYAKAKRGQVELVAHLGPQWAPDVSLHAMHPGWVATSGVDAGLPGFGKIMGPLLRSADQGADTLVWLAATGGGDAAPGQFWLDRRPRGTVYWPGTGTDDRERETLVEWLDLMTLPAVLET